MLARHVMMTSQRISWLRVACLNQSVGAQSIAAKAEDPFLRLAARISQQRESESDLMSGHCPSVRLFGWSVRYKVCSLSNQLRAPDQTSAAEGCLFSRSEAKKKVATAEVDGRLNPSIVVAHSNSRPRAIIVPLITSISCRLQLSAGRPASETKRREEKKQEVTG